MEITLELFGIIIGCSLGFVVLLNIALVIMSIINIVNTGVRSLNKAWWIIICIFGAALGCLLYYCLGANVVRAAKKKEAVEETVTEEVAEVTETLA